jgi:hypothetical protein
VIAANKVDALSRGEANRRRQLIARSIGARAVDVLAVSAERGAGLEDLWNVIRGAAFAPREMPTDTPAARGREHPAGGR